MNGTEIPVCEITIHKPYDEVVALHEPFGKHLFKYSNRCSIEVERVLQLEPHLQSLLLGGFDLSLCARVREAGGFATVKGEAEIICNNEGLPLRGSCAHTPTAFRETLWFRTFNRPVFILRATAEYADGDEMINKAIAEEAGDVWAGNTKVANLVGVYRRVVPKEWQSFNVDVNNISDQIIEACNSTRERKLENYSSKTLDMAIDAVFEKAQCESCAHTHYGLIQVKEGIPQPLHNLTKLVAIERIARYDPSSSRYHKKTRDLNKPNR